MKTITTMATALAFSDVASGITIADSGHVHCGHHAACDGNAAFFVYDHMMPEMMRTKMPMMMGLTVA